MSALNLLRTHQNPHCLAPIVDRRRLLTFSCLTLYQSPLAAAGGPVPTNHQSGGGGGFYLGFLFVSDCDPRQIFDLATNESGKSVVVPPSPNLIQRRQSIESDTYNHISGFQLPVLRRSCNVV
jgi:hypothetical protein